MISNTSYIARLLIGVLVVTSSFLLSVHLVLAQPAATMNYQAKLTDPTGLAVADGTYNVRFWLLQSTTQATTSAVWTESLTGADRVTVTDGLFSVMLGSTSPLTGVDFNQPLFLGVEIGGTSVAPAWDGEMSPRKPLGTVPAAFQSFELGGVASSSFVRSDQADTISATESSPLLTINQLGSGDILNLLDNGTEVLTVLDGGNVGVGTSTDAARLSIQSTGTTDILNLFETGGAEVFTVLENGNVGVGTSSPSTRLTVAGDVNIAGALNPNGRALSIGTSTLANAALSIQSTSTADILNLFETDGAEVFTVLESGNVGVGTTTPQYRLSVDGNIEMQADGALYAGGIRVFDVETTTGGQNIALGAGTFSSGFDSLAIGRGTIGTGGSRAVVVGAQSDTNSQNYVTILGSQSAARSDHTNVIGNGVSKIVRDGATILGSGGVTAPLPHSLYLVGTYDGTLQDGELFSVETSWLDDTVSTRRSRADLNVFTSTGSSTFLSSYNDGTQLTTFLNPNGGTLSIGTSTLANAALSIQSTSTADILNLFETDGAEVFTVLENGNVGVGTSSPASTLDVWGDVRIGTGSVPTLFTDVSAGRVGIGTSSPQRTLHVFNNADGAPVRFEDTSGYCEINPISTSWTCTSDERLKDNVSALDAGQTLEKLITLEPSTFTWINDDSDTTRTGLIAQDVEMVFPDLVQTDEKGLKSVAYGGFIPYILSSIQGIWERVEGFATRFTTDELCVGEVCVTEAEFAEVFAGQAATAQGSTDNDTETNGTDDTSSETQAESTDLITSSTTATSTSDVVVSDTTPSAVVSTTTADVSATTTDITESGVTASTTRVNEIVDTESAQQGTTESEETIGSVDVTQNLSQEEEQVDTGQSAPEESDVSGDAAEVALPVVSAEEEVVPETDPVVTEDSAQVGGANE